MDVKTLEQIAGSQFIWAIVALAIAWGFYRQTLQQIKDVKEENNKREDQLMSIYEDQKSESKVREERLMDHVEKTTETLTGISSNLEKMEKDMTIVNTRIDDVWRTIQGRRQTDGGNVS